MGTGLGLVSCMMNGDLARKAVLAYAQDHEGKLPNAATWQDDIRPYYERLYTKLMEDENLKEMPDWMNIKVASPGTVLECELSGGKKTGFAFNTAIAGKLLSEFTTPTTTILIFETTSPAYNASGDPTARNANDPILKFYGDKREWLDFMIEGESEMFESADSDFDFDIRPEDGLPPKDGTTPGTPNSAGA
jgi:hypothetical protein